MKNIYEQSSIDFEELNVRENLIKMNEQDIKVENKIKILVFSALALLLSSLISAFIISDPAIPVNKWYIIPTLLAGIVPITTFLSYEKKLMKYLRGKCGYNYYENKLIEVFREEEKQKIIINYFNNVGQTYTELTININKLKTSFAQNDYHAISAPLTHLLNNIYYRENKRLQEEKLEIERKEFEKKIGINSNHKNEEIEYNGQLKKYL